MSTSEYTVLDYLLDRANIHDTITKLFFLVDTREFDRVPKEVFMEEVDIDYTSLFGGEPYRITSKDQIRQWQALLGHMEKSSHVTTSILSYLPQPGTGPRPTKTSATANTVTSLVCKAVFGDPIVQSGGYYNFELVRDPSFGGNPWRISAMKANVAWIKGNMAVYQDPAKKTA